MHNELNQFYEDWVRLGKERQVLAQHRDTNLDRLKNGLKNLGYPSNFDYRNQGSYAMYTINQHPNKDYDIDVAIIFHKDNLPSSALDARKRIEAAMIEGGGNFSTPPEAKTNAVRVYYAEGHHIDLAIYRQYEGCNDNLIYEHAGNDWASRDPMAITDWFNAVVRKSSPSKEQGATVNENQMRRIVRLLKAFAKSRAHWNLPGGLMISVLVAECYRPDFHQDDICLYNTMVSIWNRLKMRTDIRNPVDAAQALTHRPVDIARVEQFRDRLEVAISHLETLNNPKCTEEQAVNVWYWLFRHPFWSADNTILSAEKYGECLGEASRSGNIFVTATGRVLTKIPEELYISAPPQRFYGSS